MPPPSSLSRKLRTMFLLASTIATISEPRQMEPNECVIERRNESLTPREQNDDASVGTNHQVPTAPATVTWTTFCITCAVQ